jgi:crossover junction endodeoxyribonuclease RuvC
MFRILGVDPGSAFTGYGVIAARGNEFSYVTSGVIKLPRGASRYEKLRIIFTGLAEVIAEHRPTHFAIEEVFYSKNPRSALVLGEARGVAILAAAEAGLPIDEYSAREVKQSVTGNGAAHKSQVGFMLGKLLGLSPPPESEDETDALAIAMCHAFKNREWTTV